MTDLSAPPNFLILGAAKAGTTALYEMLQQHPQVFLPYIKEPMFFSHDENYQRGLDWYVATYFGKARDYPARGEATPHYLYWAEKSAARIASCFSQREMRFIVILRNPITRAYSWYWNMVKEGKEELPFLEALRAEPARLEKEYDKLKRKGAMTYGYMRGSDYVPQIETFFQFFPREQFFFMKQEDIRESGAARVHELLHFLGVTTEFNPHAAPANPAKLPRSRKLHALLHERSWIKDALKKILPLKLRYQLKVRLREANLQPFSYPPMEEDARILLHEKFLPQIAQLERLTNLDLSEWK